MEREMEEERVQRPKAVSGQKHKHDVDPADVRRIVDEQIAAHEERFHDGEIPGGKTVDPAAIPEPPPVNSHEQSPASDVPPCIVCGRVEMMDGVVEGRLFITRDDKEIFICGQCVPVDCKTFHVGPEGDKWRVRSEQQDDYSRGFKAGQDAMLCEGYRDLREAGGIATPVDLSDPKQESAHQQGFLVGYGKGIYESKDLREAARSTFAYAMKSDRLPGLVLITEHDANKIMRALGEE